MARVPPMPPGMWQRMTPEARRKHLKSERATAAVNGFALLIIPPLMVAFLFEMAAAFSKGAH